jgi:lipocalin-like protein
MIDLIGSWRLLDCTLRSRAGEIIEHPYGRRPSGLLLYTSDGRVSVHIAAREREPLSQPDPRRAEEAECARAFTTYLGHSGRFETRDESVVHTVEICSNPNLVGTEQVRSVSTHGGELSLRTPPVETPDGPVVYELRWTRS